MEAFSIQPVTGNARPAAVSAQSGLGDIFQVLLRDSVERQETPVRSPRPDGRPERDAPRRTSADDRGVTAGDRRDRPDRREAAGSAYRADDAPATVDRRPASADNAKREQDPPTAMESQPPRQSATADRPSEVRDDEPPAADGGREADAQIAAVGENSVVVLDPARPTAGSQALGAPTAGADGLSGQVNLAAIPPAATGPATGAASSAAPTVDPAPSPAPPPPSAPGTGSGTAAPATATGGNGVSAQVTVTPAPVVATPNAGLGGGAATAAMAAANTSGLTGPQTPGIDPGTGTGPSGTPPDSAASAGAARPSAIATTAQVAPPDGEALTTQTAAAAAAAAVQKRDGGSGQSATRNGAAASALLTGTGGAESSIPGSVPARPAQSGQAQISGGLTADASGQTPTGPGDGAKAGNAQNQPAPSTQQGQNDQAVKAGNQTATAANQPAATAPAAPGTSAQSPIAGARTGDPGATGGAAGSTEAASSRLSGPSMVATGGFSQAMVRGPGTVDSPTRSGGAPSTTATQVAVAIQKAVGAGKDQIRIRLNPAELGQIDVSLKVRRDGTIKAIVTVDRPETFDLMQRDARGLERALQDAGLKADSGSLSFNLRGGDQNASNHGQRGQNLAQSDAETDRNIDSAPPETRPPAPTESNRALDIRV